MAGKSHHRAIKEPGQLLVGAVIAVALLLALPSLAFADYEQAPEHFGVSGEAEQLLNSNGLAVNDNGAGGIEAGTIYAVGRGGRVVRFTAGAEGEPPQFREAWGWSVGNEQSEFQRCGPAYAEEPRPPGTFATCRPIPFVVSGGEESGHFGDLASVAVDQVTGDVYVLNSGSVRKHHFIEVFTANGEPIGEGFGDLGNSSATSPESIAEGPEKLHEQRLPEEAGMAVDDQGDVFVIDRDFPAVPPDQKVSRVMSFEPEVPGNYEHYVYSGENKDITQSEANAGDSRFRRIALVGPDRLVAGFFQTIHEYPIGEGPSSSICTQQVSGGQVGGVAANPLTGEVFYFVQGAHSKLRRLGPCNPDTGQFEELQEPITPAPETESLVGLAVNPSRAWSALRPDGILYGVDAEIHGAQRGIGDVFVPAAGSPPAVESEAVVNTTPTSSTLQAEIDPRGSITSYRFQYLTQAQFEANEPDERQSVTVSAGAGVFGLGFEGRDVGGAATGDLTAGSPAVTSLITARGTADVHAAKGTATLKGAVGKGTIISGSAAVTAVTAAEGAFAVGQTITGAGIPAGTTITSIVGSELNLSAAATESAANTTLSAGTTALTSVATSEGEFEVGMLIEGVGEGAGIPAGTTITAISGTKLTLSKPTIKPGTGVEIKAGSTTLDGVSTSEGRFQPGQPIAGEGIAAGTTITGVQAGELQISKPATKPGSGVAVSSAGPAPLAIGETVEGPGVAAGTTIVAAEAGELTLSQPATASASGVQLLAGLPFDASPAEVQRSLEALATVGRGDVEVSGGPGDESGSHPYVVTFAGGLSNQNLPELDAEATGLSGGPAGATVATQRDGGEGFVGAVEVPTVPATLGPGGTATAPASGLEPETRYRFRVIATSECKGGGEPLCETLGPPASFMTYPVTAAGLPDHRAYELVSPAQKHGGEVFSADPFFSSCGICKAPPSTDIFSVFPMQSSPGGDSVSYAGYPFSSTEGAAVYNSYISRRTPSGWQTTAMSPRLLPNESQLAYAASLEEGAITLGAGREPQLAPGAPANYANLYLQDAGNPGALQPVLSDSLFEARPPHRGEGTLKVVYLGHSPDFSAQFFSANDVLTGPSASAPEPPDPGFSGHDLYEWRSGNLRLVNVLPGNSSVATGASIASASPDTHAVSENGTRVFWNAGGHLYVREDGESTTEINDPGKFLTASPDGSQVLLSDGCLYSLEAEGCTDLTQGQGGFRGIVGQSKNFARIYFVDTAALTSDSEPGSCNAANPESKEFSKEKREEEEEEEGRVPQGRGCNLYLYETEEGTHFIATLSSRDSGVETAIFGLVDWASNPGQRTAEASPNGRYLAFGSTAALTGNDNVGACNPESSNTAPCMEVFLFDADTGNITCASCNPSGEAPLGNSVLRRIAGVTDDGHGFERAIFLPQPRYLTDQGRLFFDSSDRISPLDTNGRVEDVYEYEPAGVGTCARAAGCVSLISPGTGSVDSNFLAMNEGGEGAEAGSDVFFTTRERLAPADSDELVDVYDARAGGGFPRETETQRTECQGESCQPVPQAPNDPTPGSSSFHGAGNVKEATKHHKHHKKKHQRKKRHHKKGRRAAGHDRGGAK